MLNLARTSDADVFKEIVVKLLRKVPEEAVTLLIKVKVHKEVGLQCDGWYHLLTNTHIWVQIGTIRPIRVDHTNFFQVAIKTILFIHLKFSCVFTRRWYQPSQYIKYVPSLWTFTFIR